jgi:hypothetical protein
MSRDINSIDYIDDEKDYDELDKALKETTSNRRNVLIKEIDIEGEKLLNEISRKNKRKLDQKKEQISYILKKSKTIVLSEEDLNELDFHEIKSIYDKTVYENRPFMKKFIEFIFNL